MGFSLLNHTFGGTSIYGNPELGLMGGFMGDHIIKNHQVSNQSVMVRVRLHEPGWFVMFYVLQVLNPG